MLFHFDPDKSAANRTKHRIDFVEAQELWRDIDRVDVPARTEGEPRMATIGRIAKDVWVAIRTPRGYAVRIISVRRARKGERELYGA